MRKFLLMIALALVTTGAVEAKPAKVNEYKDQFIIGQDDNLSTFPLTFGTAGFTRILGWDAATIEMFRQDAIAWFTERFGINFEGVPINPETGGYYNGFATMNGLSFEGLYRVEESTSKKIPPYKDSSKSLIQLCEFTVTFDPGAVFNYTGTYGGAGFPGNPSDDLAFGCYLVAGKYHFFMKSDIPASTDASGRSREVLLLNSPTYGAGLSIMNVGLSFTPNSDGKFPTYIHALWSFPGSFVIPEYSSFTTPPAGFENTHD